MAAMVTVIHVGWHIRADTVLSLSLCLTPLSFCLSVGLSHWLPSVPGGVTAQSVTTKEEACHCYRKRRCTKAVILPLLHQHFNYTLSLQAFVMRGLGTDTGTHTHVRTQWTTTDTETLNSSNAELPCLTSLMFMFVVLMTSLVRTLQYSTLTSCSGQSELLIFKQGHGKSHLFPFKHKNKWIFSTYF